MASGSIALEHVTGKPLLLWVFGDKTEKLWLGRVEADERDILQCEEVVVARQAARLIFQL